MRKDIAKALKLVEDRVVPILLVNDLAELIDKKDGHRFSNLRLTKKGKEDIGYTAAASLKITDEWMASYRSLFPRQRRSSPKAVKDKLNRFIEDNGLYSLSEIYKAAEMYINDQSNPMYVCNADHFFYKFEPDGSMRSYCQQYLTILNEEGNHDEDYEDFSGSRMITS